MEMLQGVWKQQLRPRAVVGYGVKIFHPSPPNYVTRSPGYSSSELSNPRGHLAAQTKLKLIGSCVFFGVGSGNQSEMTRSRSLTSVVC